DHCLQYMTAIPLIFGRLGAADYEDDVAADPRVDSLRAKMRVIENPEFTRNYYDLEKRYIGNAVQVTFADGSRTARVAVETPVGHRERRAEGVPMLVEKFRTSVAPKLGAARFAALDELFDDAERLAATPVEAFMGMLAI
ncbi:MAG TPA: 2-methylcitrate dehydratase, partial [Lacipirellulaceae bacterium]|nr:2-methylcitrate dehydratase [Lacipirellulaceae bacterium]